MNKQMVSTDNKQLPLAGITVIEAGSLIAASYCGQLLGDFGATVIKIEAPSTRAIDSLRQWGRHHTDGEGFLSSVLNRNKKLVTLDITSADGAALFRQLLQNADLLIENFKPGTLAGWGFGDEVIADINKRLIHVGISGFGQTGPLARQSAFGAIAEAMGGLRALTGYEGQPPVRGGVSIGDFLAGLYAAFGATVALVERNRSNQGQVVDVAIYEAVLGVIEDLLPAYQFFDAVRGPVGSGFDRFAPSNVYPTADGSWVLIAAPTDNTFRKFLLVLGRPEVGTDERFATQEARARNKAAIDDVVAAWTRTKSADEIVDILRRHDVPSGKVYTAPDIINDPHIKARGMVVDAPDIRVGSVQMQGVVPKLSRTAGEIRHAGGRIGTDTDEIYGSLLGLGEAELADLRARKVI
jgi:crotonobetainyl-CoA:carnitine CoA-transferase CaiB-like acyl-CoA transferase